jgi:hypothetical protein
MRPSFGTRRTRLPGMQKLYDISDSFFCAMHIGAFQLNSSFEKSQFGTQHVKKILNKESYNLHTHAQFL